MNPDDGVDVHLSLSRVGSRDMEAKEKDSKKTIIIEASVIVSLPVKKKK